MGKKKQKFETVTMTLPVALTPKEREQKLEELRATLDDIESLEDEKKRFAEQWKEREGARQARGKELRLMLKAGAELRPVECAIDMNYDRGVAETVRLDTREVVASRPMTVAERQVKLADVIDARRSTEPEEERPSLSAVATLPAEPPAPPFAVGLDKDGKELPLDEDDATRFLAGESVFVEITGVSYELVAIKGAPKPKAPVVGVAEDDQEVELTDEEAATFAENNVVDVVRHVDMEDKFGAFRKIVKHRIVKLKAAPDAGEQLGLEDAREPTS